ncbi:uncharacterized protein [Arachis hypogaea]|uniref:uncharacterized protein isoform X3 n=1 Tax=Arachis hypogaea TaxID=3818 RepID=UPI000DEC52A6
MALTLLLFVLKSVLSTVFFALITLSVALALASIYSNESGAGKGLPLNLAIGVSKITLNVARALAFIYSNESGAGKGLPLNLIIGVSKVKIYLLNV